MKKKLLIVSLLMAMVFGTVVFAESEDIGIFVHGKEVESDAAPFIFEDRTMVPLRFISEALGFSVEWDGEARVVTVTDKDSVLTLKIDDKTATVNGEQVLMDVAPMIQQDRTFVPLRFVAEVFCQVVDWDPQTRTVSVIREQDLLTEDKDYEGRYIIVDNPDLSSVLKDKETPKELKKGEVGIIYKAEGDLLYVDLIRPVGDAIEDWSFAMGYIPKKNVILNPRPEELESKTKIYHLRNEEILFEDSKTGEKYKLPGNEYVESIKKEKDRVLIEMAGGANPAWVSREYLDFELEHFTGNPGNME